MDYKGILKFKSRHVFGLMFVFFTSVSNAYEAQIDNESSKQVSISGTPFWVDNYGSNVDVNDYEKYQVNVVNAGRIPIPYTAITRKGGHSVKIQLYSESGGKKNSSYGINRSEINIGRELPIEKIHWVKFSVYFHPDFPNPDDWFAFFQAQQVDAGPPIIGFYLTKAGQLKITVRNDDYAGDWGLNVYQDTKTVVRGKWLDFVVAFKGSLSKKGYLHVWRKTEDQKCYDNLVDYNNLSIGKSFIPSTGEAATNLVFNAKFGMYRGGSDLNHQAWFDEINYNEIGPLFFEDPPICE